MGVPNAFLPTLEPNSSHLLPSNPSYQHYCRAKLTVSQRSRIFNKKYQYIKEATWNRRHKPQINSDKLPVSAQLLCGCNGVCWTCPVPRHRTLTYCLSGVVPLYTALQSVLLPAHTPVSPVGPALASGHHDQSTVHDGHTPQGSQKGFRSEDRAETSRSSSLCLACVYGLTYRGLEQVRFPARSITSSSSCSSYRL
jgi:hypothetical protein